MILTFQLVRVSTWGHIWPRWSQSLSIHIFSVCYSCIIVLFFSRPALPNSITLNIGSLNQPSILLILAHNQLYQLRVSAQTACFPSILELLWQSMFDSFLFPWVFFQFSFVFQGNFPISTHKYFFFSFFFERERGVLLFPSATGFFASECFSSSFWGTATWTGLRTWDILVCHLTSLPSHM